MFDNYTRVSDYVSLDVPGCDWHGGPMPYTDEQRRKLADTVHRARVDKGLDKEPAARAAKVSSITWKRVEDGEAVRDASLSKILAAVGLPSAEDILADQVKPEQSNPWGDTHTVELSSVGLVHELNLLWGTWRDLTADVLPLLNGDLARRNRRAMIITADVTLDLLGLSPPAPMVDELTTEVTSYVNDLFNSRMPMGRDKEDDLEAEAEPDAPSEANESKEAGLLDEAEERASLRRIEERLSPHGIGIHDADDAVDERGRPGARGV